MRFESKKTENCFSGSQTWEYRLPISGQALAALLPPGWEKRENRRLRRPVFVADRDGVNVKGLLAGDVVRASFPEGDWQARKAAFEDWLEGLDV